MFVERLNGHLQLFIGLLKLLDFEQIAHVQALVELLDRIEERVFMVLGLDAMSLLETSFRSPFEMVNRVARGRLCRLLSHMQDEVVLKILSLSIGARLF